MLNSSIPSAAGRALAPILAIDANLKLGVFNAPPAPGALVNQDLEVGWVDASYG